MTFALVLISALITPPGTRMLRANPQDAGGGAVPGHAARGGGGVAGGSATPRSRPAAAGGPSRRASLEWIYFVTLAKALERAARRRLHDLARWRDHVIYPISIRSSTNSSPPATIGSAVVLAGVVLTGMPKAAPIARRWRGRWSARSQSRAITSPTRSRSSRAELVGGVRGRARRRHGAQCRAHRVGVAAVVRAPGPGGSCSWA